MYTLVSVIQNEQKAPKVWAPNATYTNWFCEFVKRAVLAASGDQNLPKNFPNLTYTIIPVMSMQFCRNYEKPKNCIKSVKQPLEIQEDLKQLALVNNPFQNSH